MGQSVLSAKTTLGYINNILWPKLKSGILWQFKSRHSHNSHTGLCYNHLVQVGIAFIRHNCSNENCNILFYVPPGAKSGRVKKKPHFKNCCAALAVCIKTCFCHLTVVWCPLAEERLAISMQSIHRWKLHLVGYNSVTDNMGLSSFV